MTARVDLQRAAEQLLADAFAGRLTRRQMMTRAAALGLSTAAIAALPTATYPGTRRALAQDAAAKPGGILKVGLQADPTALDPHKQSLTAIWHVVEHIYSRLDPRQTRPFGRT